MARKESDDKEEPSRFSKRICEGAATGYAVGGCVGAAAGAVGAGLLGWFDGLLCLLAGEDPDGPSDP